MKKHSADLLVGVRAVFSSAYQEMESPYSVSNDPDLDTEALKARQDFRKRTHTDQDDALLVLRDCTEMASAVGELKSTKPPVNVFDAVKMAARQARISRNAMRVYPVIKWEVMARTRREHDLANAIERTQLPHEMTIHERIMPYRVKE